MKPYTLAEQAIAGLFWDGTGDLNRFTLGFCYRNSQAIRRLLYQDHLRLPVETPEEAYIRRCRKAKGLTVKEIESSLPGCYTAPDWRGFAYTQHAFRDWHFVTHTANLAQLTRANPWIHTDTRRTTRDSGVSWLYLVDAQGLDKHLHGLVSFVFPHTEASVRSLINLPSDTQLAPIWGSFDQAYQYLNKQALEELEVGQRPNRRIWLDGNQVDLPRSRMLAAVSSGENTTGLENTSRLDAQRAIRGWSESVRNLRNYWKPARIRLNKRIDARLRAEEEAAKYSGKYFVIDYKQLLPGGVFLKQPKAWFGEEVVLVLDVPKNLVSKQLSAKWLTAVPVVIYTVKPC